jgi:hypothetical protein
MEPSPLLLLPSKEQRRTVAAAVLGRSLWGGAPEAEAVWGLDPPPIVAMGTEKVRGAAAAGD